MFWTPIRYRGAIHLSTLDLWLDPRSKREWAFISHAHSDHIAGHEEAILSEGTYRFICHRNVTPKHAQILPFNEPHTIRGVEFTLFPAGHILGSAQLQVSINGQRLLYSGDFKLQSNQAAESITVPQADVLIMETTFGHPRYAFPPSDKVLEAIAVWCDNCLFEGVTPVLLGYSLGKGQEILAGLAGHGYRFLLHDALYQTTRIAEELVDVAFPAYDRWSPGMGDGCVVICPPHLRKWIVPKLPPCKTAIVSGWAMDPSARFRYGADAAFCLSDHADYNDLHEYVQRVNPQHIYTVHGYASDFAAELRRRGYDAHALDEPDQLALF
ncbi:MAG TPA: MBL fold metallo-hydrolase RNA specificity domain-containing protein [Armatimonadota bacterium]|nr:MBL fold metallo-hydrolase RNA specificity domain-containing protein [Armatimonadota bacterium]